MEATENALKFATEALGDSAKGVRLEEVDSTVIKGESCWLVTLSMLDWTEQEPFGSLRIGNS